MSICFACSSTKTIRHQTSVKETNPITIDKEYKILTDIVAREKTNLYRGREKQNEMQTIMVQNFFRRNPSIVQNSEKKWTWRKKRFDCNDRMRFSKTITMLSKLKSTFRKWMSIDVAASKMQQSGFISLSKISKANFSISLSTVSATTYDAITFKSDYISLRFYFLHFYSLPPLLLLLLLSHHIFAFFYFNDNENLFSFFFCINYVVTKIDALRKKKFFEIELNIYAEWCIYVYVIGEIFLNHAENGSLFFSCPLISICKSKMKLIQRFWELRN